MKEIARSHRCLKTTCFAIVTMLAVLIAPFCGPICAASSGCDHGAAISASDDSCHHSATATPSTSDSATLSNARSCNQHDLFAIVSSDPTWPSALDSSASAISFESSPSTDYDLAVSRAEWRGDDPPATRPAAPSTSVLRI